ncbi:MAG: DMT family transporter [Gammaproteobacteria bacterium]
MPPKSPDNIPAACALMVLGVLLVAAMDATAKVLSETLPLAQIVWSRFAFHSVWLAPAALFLAGRGAFAAHFGARQLAGHAVRGLLIALSTVFYFAAIRDNPIPDAIAIFFVEPVFVMFLAAIFLGEKLRRRRIFAGLAAFAGVLIVLRPGGGHYTPEILLSLAAGLAFAGYIIATKISSVRGSPLLTAWGTALAGMLIAAPFAYADWRAPDEREWILLAQMGALAAGGHLGITYACRFADASLVAMFHYSEIIAAAFISYLIFNHIPDGWVWVGFALIAGAKISVTFLEMREKRRG